MKRLAIVPARAGSKRIKKKNIKLFYGKPILGWIIETLIKSKLFYKIVVSTDNPEIELIAKEFGAEVPFLRPAGLSGDYISVMEAIKHAVSFYNSKQVNFEQVGLFYATAPFTTVDQIKQAIIALKKHEFAISVCRYSHPIERALQINKKTSSLTLKNKNTFFKRTQDLEATYFDAGMFITGHRSSWEKYKHPFLAKKTFPVVIPNLYTHDIDEPEDWYDAEIKFETIRKINKID